jgi:hypothetical protein
MISDPTGASRDVEIDSPSQRTTRTAGFPQACKTERNSQRSKRLDGPAAGAVGE